MNNSEVPVLTLQAVKCVVCGQLHEVGATSYLTAVIRIVRRRGGDRNRPVNEVPTTVGIPGPAAVLCDNYACLAKAVGGDPQ